MGLAGTALPAAAHANHGDHDNHGDSDAGALTLGLELVASGFESPVDYLQAPEDRDRAFVPDQPGQIHVVDEKGRRPEPFLDIRAQVAQVHNEAGLLGLAFHPEFSENRRFYVHYSAPKRAGTPESYSHTFVVSEFQATADGLSADPNSERTLLEIPEPQGNHNGADLDFGPDGHLYIGVGDGGGANDQGRGHVEDWYDAVDGGNGQDVTENLLGSILRIDVDDRPGEKPYGIPEDNPLVGEEGLDEHYAWGLRNPWRLSFDDETGRLFVSDVGQDSFEEIDIVEKGGNYGWNVREGRNCFQAETCPSGPPNADQFFEPILDYPHENADGRDGPLTGISVSGGHVYRGEEIPALQGVYVFGDYAVGDRLFVGDPPRNENNDWDHELVQFADAEQALLPNLISIGRDRAGELYLTTRGQESGAVYRLVEGDPSQTTTVAVDDTPPATEDESNTGQGAPTTPARSPGPGLFGSLVGLSAGLGLARWLRR